jgi:hypothetical protein
MGKFPGNQTNATTTTQSTVEISLFQSEHARDAQMARDVKPIIHFFERKIAIPKASQSLLSQEHHKNKHPPFILYLLAFSAPAQN